MQSLSFSLSLFLTFFLSFSVLPELEKERNGRKTMAKVTDSKFFKHELLTGSGVDEADGQME